MVNHPDLATNLTNLAALLAATNRPNEALENMIEATKIEDRMISQVFATSSENDRLVYLQKIRHNLDAFLSLVLKYLCHSTEAIQAALNIVLKRKALTAAALAAQNQALYSGRYPHLISEFQKLRSLSEQIVHLTFSLPKSDELTTYKQRLAKLQAEYNQLQKILASKVAEIQLQKEIQTVNSHFVALELPEGTSLVEFIYFRVRDFKAVRSRGEAQWQPARYLAFVLPAKQPDKVQMIDLGEAEHIDRLIRIFRSEASLEDYNAGDSLGMVKKKTAPVSKLKTFKYNPEPGIKLREAIFDPIRAVLGESKHLLISPDGELNLIPFQILPIDETGKQLLIDEYTISYLSVGRDVLRSKIQPTRPTSKPLVIADPDFNLNTKQKKNDTHFEQGCRDSTNFDSISLSVSPSMSSNIELLNSLPGKGFNRAPGTRFLGEAIAQKLGVMPYVDAEAVESHVTSSQSPSILLIATHGFFLPDLPQETPLQERKLFGSDRFSATKVENPMLRSGLALAGANIWLSGGTLPEKAGKGFLFAQDVAALDLWANELTVLSACNTAIGDVKIGEGVFGLRRAFAVAGTKTLVMSLWPVPDKATALLMERFFDNLERGFGRSNALLESQNYIRTITVRELRQLELGREVLEDLLAQNDSSCQDERPLEHPFYWGAWVCQGETTELKDVVSLKNFSSLTA